MKILEIIVFILLITASIMMNINLICELIENRKYYKKINEIIKKED